MGLNIREHFENQIDVTSPETAEDVDKIVELSEENPYDDAFEDMISKAQGDHFECSNREIGRIKEEKGSKTEKQDIVFSSIADANFDYGKGGGNQYFIQNAAAMKQDGRLSEISREETNFNPDTDIFKADIRSSQCIYDSSNKKQVSNYLVHFDSRELSEEEMKEMMASIISTGQPEDSNASYFTKDQFPDSELNMDEINYLDENTPSADALTKVEVGQRHEDYLHPLGNQEDSRGFNHPDIWSNPKKLQEGAVYYQLSPVFKNGTTDTKSSYFTDKETVESCRNKDGNISLSALMQKLQVAPKFETIKDENGNIHDEYITKYIITVFEYSSKGHAVCV